MARLVCSAGDDQFFTHTAFAPLQQVAEAFARADLFVFPTFAEGSSRSGMEAAAAGLPIITTENCGLPLEHGKSAIYVPVNDSDALAEAICQLSSQEGLREQIGRNAMRTVTEHYTWTRYGDRSRSTCRKPSKLPLHDSSDTQPEGHG